MITLDTTATRDIFVDAQGNLAFARDAQAIANVTARAAMTRRGDMVLFPERGLPMFEAVWNSPPRLALYEAALRARLLAVRGVQEIESLLLTREGGVLRYRAQLRTIYGPRTVNG